MESMLHNKHVQKKQEQVQEQSKRNFTKWNDDLRADEWAKCTKHERDQHQIETTVNIENKTVEKMKTSHEVLKIERINADNSVASNN